MIIEKRKSTVFQNELRYDEHLLWSGRPQQGIMFHSYDLFMIPFSLFWGGFAIFWTVMASATGGGFGLFGIPFVLMGLYMIVGRFFADALQRSKTYYGLTAERVLIVSGLFSQQTKSLSLRTLPEITLKERGSGTGTITFGPDQPFANWYRGASWPGMGRPVPPAFEGIANVRWVYDQILLAQRQA